MNTEKKLLRFFSLMRFLPSFSCSAAAFEREMPEYVLSALLFVLCIRIFLSFGCFYIIFQNCFFKNAYIANPNALRAFFIYSALFGVGEQSGSR